MRICTVDIEVSLSFKRLLIVSLNLSAGLGVVENK